MHEARLSVIIPCHNEIEAAAALAAEIESACQRAGLSWEAVWIDDGSTDGTRELLMELTAPHRVLLLDERSGQSAAMMAGMRAARGDWVATLDGDGQNDPADLPLLLARAQDGKLDMAIGFRARRHDSWTKRVASKIANWIRRTLTGDHTTDTGCSTRVFRRWLVADIPFFHGVHRFLPNIARMRGATIGEFPVNHRPRTGGTSKYSTLGRAWWAWNDLLGVRWLQRRAKVWHAVEWPTGPKLPESDNANQSAASSREPTDQRL